VNKHDKVAIRLALILNKLNSTQKLDVEELAQEFGVTKRTIQRDLNQRLDFLPLKKENNLYSLEEYYLGKLNVQDISNFATICGIKELFPTLDTTFLSRVLDESVNQAYLIKGQNYEDISSKTVEFEMLQDSILQQKIVVFRYNEKQREIRPYRLVNIKGIWYLVGIEAKELKTFSFKKIIDLKLQNATFEKQEDIEQIIVDGQTLWFSQKKIEVVLKVNAKVAYSFKRRTILPYQKIVKELHNHDLLIETQVSFEEEILKLVRYWIPNVEIISPNSLKKKLYNELLEYVKA